VASNPTFEKLKGNVLLVFGKIECEEKKKLWKNPKIQIKK
jgi:hypothetical protein